MKTDREHAKDNVHTRLSDTAYNSKNKAIDELEAIVKRDRKGWYGSVTRYRDISVEMERDWHNPSNLYIDYVVSIGNMKVVDAYRSLYSGNHFYWICKLHLDTEK